MATRVAPMVQAPLLRTDKDRREWMSKELELCNMSCEFRKVIDGELAQRAEASRKLKVSIYGLGQAVRHRSPHPPPVLTTCSMCGM